MPGRKVIRNRASTLAVPVGFLNLITCEAFSVVRRAVSLASQSVYQVASQPAGSDCADGGGTEGSLGRGGGQGGSEEVSEKYVGAGSKGFSRMSWFLARAGVVANSILLFCRIQ